jgi:hypothetical protein
MLMPVMHDEYEQQKLSLRAPQTRMCVTLARLVSPKADSADLKPTFKP